MQEQIEELFKELISQNTEILAIMRTQLLAPNEVTQVRTIVGSGKYPMAYYSCDGINSQAEICKITGVASGNLSNKIKDWERAE
jgi:hypothetical protein